MCGIVVIKADLNPIPAAALEAATHCLAHRGPEASRFWIAPHGRIGLGHTRLSIIAPDDGEQPIASEDGQLRVVANGEFYGFESIRRELRRLGHRFRTGSDSEIAIHLYEGHGVRCLDRLRGEFAFAIWDETKQCLFAARDRFGTKPLFYAQVGECLYLASEAKALFAAAVPARWDRESLFQHLFASLDQDRTLFAGIRQIPPGYYLLASGGRVELFRYWDLDYPRHEEAPRLCESDLLGGLRDRLVEATRLRLKADVPDIGCYLSGGIDSSGILGMASAHSERPIRAFTVGFDLGTFDESSIARRTAEACGVAFRSVRVTSGDLATHLDEVVAHYENLLENAHWIARSLLSRAAHEHGIKVVLCGDGADEIFAGYSFCVRDAAMTSVSGSMVPEALPPGDGPGAIHASLAGVRRILGFVPSFLESLVRQRSAFRGLLAKDFVREFTGRDPYECYVRQFDIEGQLDGRHPLVQSMYLWSRSILANYILAVERVDAAHAIEVRIPYLDHELVEYARQIPACLLVQNGREKYLLREALQPLVTEAVYRRRKHAFIAPPTTIRAGDALYGAIRNILEDPGCLDPEIFNSAAVAGLLDRLPGMSEHVRIRYEPILFMVASTCILKRRYGL